MSRERQEKLRQLKLKRKLKSDIRKLDEFLSTKTSLNNYFKDQIAKYSDLQAVTDTYCNVHLTYKELEEQISLFASGIQSLGINKGDFVGIYTENNGRWCVCHQGTMRTGAICTLRGSNAPATELDYILSHSEAKGVILKDGTLLNAMKPFLSNHKNLKFVVLMFKNPKDDLSGVDLPLYYFDDVLEMGKKHEFTAPEQNIDEYSIMLYTSGTTGNPKGVEIT